MNRLNKLEVFYHERLVGTIALYQNRLAAFEYDSNWLANGFSISPFSLPLEKKVFIPKIDPFEGLFGVFADSLPDGWGRLLVDRLMKKNDGVSDQISTYEALLNAYVYYTTNDVIKAGEALENINTSYLSDSAKQTYDTLNGSIADSYKEALYSQAYSSYSSGDYQSAIPTFQKLVGMDEAYRDGSAAYYLAQSFRKSGDLASAKPYYQYVVDNYAGTEKARTSKNYLAQEQ
jgi:tetratricopeptide (TPR) repeat protein